MDVLGQLVSALITGAATIVAAYVTVAHVEGVKQRRPQRRGQRSQPALWHPLPAVLVMIGGWAVGGAIAMPTAITTMMFVWSSPAMGGAVGWAFGGAVAGFLTALALRLGGATIGPAHTIALTMGWAAGGVVGGGLSWQLASISGGAIGGALGGCVGGLVIGRVLHDAMLPQRGSQLGMIAAAWAIGGAVGSILSWAFFGYVDVTAYAVAGAVTGTVIGTIGGSLMFLELGQRRRSPSIVG
jgi:hypothetical protein